MTVPITFAHRGARAELPENTIAAFRRGLELGASGLESDAWLSADGQVVLVHDDTVGRSLRRQKVRSSTAAELARFDVPTLEELYVTLGTDYELSIDAKHPEVIVPMLEVAERHDAAPRLWLCSPDAEQLFELQGHTHAQLVHSTHKDRIEQLERHACELQVHGVAAINLHRTEWKSGLVALFHRFDVCAFGWDAQELRHLRALFAMNIDGVYCDRPERMAEALRDRDSP
ncbi:MAG TPA: glycerophosphodiester phosphodiesterase family protein [Acidimicrobiia bacterium]